MVSIILVNWRGWRDTILCLQSLQRLRGAPFRILVCDNASPDDSVEMIRAWAEHRCCAWVPPAHPARALTLPPPGGPVTFAEVPAGAAEHLGAAAWLTLIQCGRNLGFAGGCNVGMRYAIARGDCDAVWLLNNDTATDAAALEALVATSATLHDTALLSSRVLYMDNPARVWFEGGEFDPRISSGRHVSRQRFAQVARPYLSGCALFIPRFVWERIGFLDDSFFMYGEDADYSIRATEYGIPLRIAEKSIVLHAEGASAGSASATAYQNLVANSIRVGRRHFSRWYGAPVLIYHCARLVGLGVLKRRSRAALAGYWRGILFGFRSAA